tara:strand:- start:459 stop:1556 length:1098 start_codon:yes stop_codon:yes gene_type:complete
MKTKYSFFLIIFTVILLIMAELVTRKIYGYNLTSKNFISEKSLLETNNSVIYDKLLSWKHKPNMRNKNGLNTNSDGHRISQKDNFISKEVVFVSGDSFAAGAEVQDDETWPFFLQSKTKMKVVNAAVGGWDSIQIIQNALHSINLYKTKIVILEFTDAIERSRYGIYASAHKSRYKFNNNELELVNYPVKKFYKKEYLKSSYVTFSDRFSNSQIVRSLFNNSIFLYKLQKKFFNRPYGLNFDKVYKKSESQILEINCKLINILNDTLKKSNSRLYVVIQHKGDTVFFSKVQPSDSVALEKCLINSKIKYLNFWNYLKLYKESNGDDKFKELFNMKNNSFGHMSSSGNNFISEKISEKFFLEKIKR